MSTVMSLHEDFKAQRPWLVEVIEDRGHRIIFYPKFHCELNFIEMIWGYTKTFLRRNCSYSFIDLCTALPHCLNHIVPLPYFRRVSRRCYRFMDGYRKGLHGPVLDYAMKKYSSHRRIPAGVLDDIQREYDNNQIAKQNKST
jgi:hypothetical protein